MAAREAGVCEGAVWRIVGHDALSKASVLSIPATTTTFTARWITNTSGWADVSDLQQRATTVGVREVVVGSGARRGSGAMEVVCHRRLHRNTCWESGTSMRVEVVLDARLRISMGGVVDRSARLDRMPSV